LKVPLILEYNHSEVWFAEQQWHPARFMPWLRLCEYVSVHGAALISVVAEALRQELLAAGVPNDKILVNPNGVDARRFHPRCGGATIRAHLGIASDEVVACFVGTFGPWHGIPVLEEAILKLYRRSDQAKLRFVLIGDGPLQPETRRKLRELEAAGRVIFTGLLAHSEVPTYLDAADILLSPHLPMPDGRPFIGSPTKLFEYMAMEKAIVASRLDQLAEVLEHGRTAWLVTPGDVEDLVEGILALCSDPALRERLGVNARAEAVQKHSWTQNTRRILHRLQAQADSVVSVEDSRR
jgi:glycosyltransferase involved in cell wall biosynthesis